jgi:hypothetical protein
MIEAETIARQNHAMHQSGGVQRFFEIKVNSRHLVMAVVRLTER